MKRYLPLLMTALTVGFAPATVLADDDESRGDRRMNKVMSTLDTNEDGVISIDEFRLPEGREPREMRMDIDGDGAVTRDEVERAVAERSEEALTRFDELDSDGNGRITTEERRTQVFAQIDRDNDGQLSPSEMRDARKAMGDKKRRHGKKHRGDRSGGPKGGRSGDRR